MVRTVEIRRAHDSALVASRCVIAETLSSRMIGLLGRRRLGEGEALWIRPCNSVHTWFMRFAVDVVFLGAKGEVLALAPNLSSFRARVCWPSKSVLELPAGTIDALGLVPGDRLLFALSPQEPPGVHTATGAA